MSKPIVPNRFGNYYGRRAYREANKRTPEAIAAEKAEKARLAKTCQICGRAIFAETGIIAHHGYQRPEGLHIQTASCPGAQHLPFEVNSDLLVKHIAAQERVLEIGVKYRSKLAADLIYATFSWTYYDKTPGYFTGGQKRTKTVDVTPDTFAAVKDENIDAFRKNGMYSYADVKNSDLRRQDSSIKQIADYIAFQKKRLAEWAGPTFKRVDDKWVTL